MKTNIPRVLCTVVLISALMACVTTNVAKADEPIGERANTQSPPTDIFYDLHPAPKTNDMFFDLGAGAADPEDLCICLHKICYPFGEKRQYIKCDCMVLICSGPRTPEPF